MLVIYSTGPWLLWVADRENLLSAIKLPTSNREGLHRWELGLDLDVNCVQRLIFFFFMKVERELIGEVHFCCRSGHSCDVEAHSEKERAKPSETVLQVFFMWISWMTETDKPLSAVWVRRNKRRSPVEHGTVRLLWGNRLQAKNKKTIEGLYLETTFCAGRLLAYSTVCWFQCLI